MAAVYICEDFSFPCVFGTLSFSLLEPPTSARPLSFSHHTQYTHTHNHRSQTQVYLAASPTLKDEAERGAAVGGTYFSDCRPKKTTKEAEDLDAAGKLWKLSEKLTGSSFSV